MPRERGLSRWRSKTGLRDWLRSIEGEDLKRQHLLPFRISASTSFEVQYGKIPPGEEVDPRFVKGLLIRKMRLNILVVLSEGMLDPFGGASLQHGIRLFPHSGKVYKAPLRVNSNPRHLPSGLSFQLFQFQGEEFPTLGEFYHLFLDLFMSLNGLVGLLLIQIETGVRKSFDSDESNFWVASCKDFSTS